MSDHHGEITFLELEDLILLMHDLNVGPVRDVGLLDSAVLRAQASAFGEDAYPTLSLKAAALLHSIANNHSLVDGNKRLSWHATDAFLGLNGCQSGLDTDEAVALVLDVATGDLDVQEIADRLRVEFLPE